MIKQLRHISHETDQDASIILSNRYNSMRDEYGRFVDLKDLLEDAIQAKCTWGVMRKITNTYKSNKPINIMYSSPILMISMTIEQYIGNLIPRTIL